MIIFIREMVAIHTENMSPTAATRHLELIATVPFWSRFVRTGRPGMSVVSSDDTENHTHVHICAYLNRRNQVSLGVTTLTPAHDGVHNANGCFVPEEGPVMLADGRSQTRNNNMVGKLRSLLTTVSPGENGTYADEDIDDTRVMQIQVIHTHRQDADLLYDFLDQQGFTNGAFIDVNPETDGPETFSIIHNDEDNEISPEDLEEHFYDYSRMLMHVPVEFYRSMLVNLLEAWNFNRN